MDVASWSDLVYLDMSWFISEHPRVVLNAQSYKVDVSHGMEISEMLVCQEHHYAVVITNWFKIGGKCNQGKGVITVISI